MALTGKRYISIVKKFEELGYRDDIHWRGAFLSRENFANKPQRLTDRSQCIHFPSWCMRRITAH